MPHLIYLGGNKMNDKILTEVYKSFVRYVTSQIQSNVKVLNSRLVYTVNLRHLMWHIQPVLGEIFPEMSEIVDYQTSSLYKDGYVIKYDKQVDDPLCLISEIKFFKGTPILLSMKSVNVKAHSDEGQSNVRVPAMYLSTIRTKKNIKNLKLFIEYLFRKGMRYSEKNWNKFIAFHKDNMLPGPTYVDNIRLRNFGNVFVPDDQRASLIKSLKQFKSKREWYDHMGLPHHFGILLHGSPGTGKSVIAQAIADYLNAELHVISGDSILDLPDMFGRSIPLDTLSRNCYRVILIEDIDCGFENNIPEYPVSINVVGTNKTNRRKKGLASLLNCLDGLSAPQNVVYVFTTNHIEKLDPALIRPGRIDLKLEIKGVNKETFDQFCKFHYNECWNGDINIPEGITFAELQIEVMKGKSLKELVDYVENRIKV